AIPLKRFRGASTAPQHPTASWVLMRRSSRQLRTISKPRTRLHPSHILVGGLLSIGVPRPRVLVRRRGVFHRDLILNLLAAANPFRLACRKSLLDAFLNRACECNGAGAGG